jgi:P27 family predicted phage terminase small subunit
MPGPARTPTQIRRAKGNPGKRAYNKREPKLPPGAPPMPEGLDAVGQQEWRRLVVIALKAQVLTEAERSILELAAEAYSTWAKARIAIQAHGLTYETTSTAGDLVIKARPEVAIASDAWRRYRAAVCELGFTPAARAKVSTVDPSEEEDPGAAYFN